MDRLRPVRRGRRLLPVVLGALLAAAAPAGRAADYYLAPPDNTQYGTNWVGHSESNPMRFTTAAVQHIINSNPLAPADPVVRLRFRPGDYPTGALFLGGGGQRQLYFLAYEPENPPVLRYDVPTDLVGFFRGPIRETWLLQAPDNVTLARFEARDLILDGNWPAWAAANTYASPAHVGGFKLGGLRARAHAGWISRVRVRNCGANGVTPWHWLGGAGTESFPLWVEAAVYQPNAWVIEKCEVRDFHSVHGGYCTAIMVTVAKPLPPNAPDPQVRVAEVRGCEVYGRNLEVGLGTAHSFGVSFHDNVVVGADRGFSVDTAEIGYVDLTNNVFLDVNLLANIGGPTWGQLNGVWPFRHFAVATNAVRLRAVPLYQNYRSYEWQAVTCGAFTNWMPVSSATLAAGRWATGFCAGLLIGGADQVRFEHNRFTTRPLAEFFEPDPANTTLARWRPFWQPAYSPVTGQVCYHGTPTVASILVSSHAMDFTNSAVLTDPALPLFALDQVPGAGFVPAGRLERVRPFFDGAGRLSDVWEIQLSQPEVVGGAVRVRARSVAHRPHAETAVWYPASLVLDVRSGPNIQVAGLSATWTNDVAWFSYPTNGAWGRDKIVVRTVGAPDQEARTVVELVHGQTVRFERMADVADDRRLNPDAFRISRSDTTGDLDVWVEALGAGGPRFASATNDYHLYTNHITSTNLWYYLPPEANGQWKIRLPAGRREASVQVRPVDNDANRNWIEFEMACFRIVTNAAYAVAPSGPWTTPGLVAESVAVTLWDGPRYRMYDLWDVSGGGGAAATGESPEDETVVTGEAAVVVPTEEQPEAVPEEWPWMRLSRTHFDNEWLGEPETIGEAPQPEAGADPAALETQGPQPGDATEAASSSETLLYTFAYAINDNTSLGFSIGGYATYWDSYLQQYSQRGGRWQSPTYGDLIQTGPRTIFGLSDANDLVGSAGGYACYVPAGTTAHHLLPPLTSEQPGEALATDAMGTWTVGWSKKNLGGTLVVRPTRWQRTGQTNWNALDLGELLLNKPGYGYGVNSSGVAVGKTQSTNQQGVSCWRAFRWNGSMQELTLPTNGLTINLLNNVANEVTAGGHAVGATDAVFVRGTEKRETRACVWWGTSNAPVTLGTIAWTDPNPWWQPGRSEALGAWETGPNSLVVVGTGWITPTGCSRAFRLELTRDSGSGAITPGEMMNLNDPQLSLLPSGRTLITAEDVNAADWIVGQAVDMYGYNLGYVLVPQGYAYP